MNSSIHLLTFLSLFSSPILPSCRLGGGKVLGIIPGALQAREQTGTEVYGEEIIVDAMHERKFMMYKASDAFVALPGGFGTLDELLEVVYAPHEPPLPHLSPHLTHDSFYD